MEHPLEELICSENAAAALVEDGCKKTKFRQNGEVEAAAIFPKRLRGRNGCRYERVDGGEDGEVVYVPLGAAHARDELGWRAKHDKRKMKLFFIRLMDTTEKAWRLPFVPESVLHAHGVFLGGGAKKRESSVELPDRTDNLLANDSDDDAMSEPDYDDDDDNCDGSEGEMLADERRENVSFTSIFLETGGPQVDDGITRKNPVTARLPLPSAEWNEIPPHGSNLPMLQVGEEEKAVPIDSKSLVNLIYTDDGTVTPLVNQNIESSRFLFSHKSSPRMSQTSCPCKESGALPFGRDMSVSDAETALGSLPAEEPKKDKVKDHIAENIHGEKETDKQGALRNAALPYVLEEVPRGNHSAEQRNQQNIKESKPHHGVSSLEDLAEENDVFLRNTHLGGFDDDEAVTPLEKLLRDGSSGGQWGRQHEHDSNTLEAGIYSNIYQPSLGISDAPVTPQLSSGSALPMARVKTSPPPLSAYEATKEEHSSPQWLLEVQRHQVEMERRLTQRDRDNMERAIDARCQRITIPDDCHPQLRYEPSKQFTRGRQALLDAIGIPDRSVPQDETKIPHEEMEQIHYQQLKQHEAPPQSRGLQYEPAPSADVSPISKKTFISSPNPSKALSLEHGRCCETVLTEACETKYEEGLEAMQKLIELYQMFVATMPHPKLPNAAPHSGAGGCYVVNESDSSATKYAELLMRIRDLYAKSGVKSHSAQHRLNNKNKHYHHHYRHRLILTPPIPRSLNYDDIDSRVTFQSYVKTPMREPMRSGDFTQQLKRDDVNRNVCSWKTPVALARREGIKTPHLPFDGEVTADDEKIDGVSHHHHYCCSDGVSSSMTPRRHHVTPHPVFPMDFPSVNESVSLSQPVLRWDAKRSGNMLISPKGTTCLADASRVLHLVATDKERTGEVLSNVFIPMYALGSIGIAEGEFIFEVRVDAHPLSTHTRDTFAVGVTTKYYRGAHKSSPAYLFRSDGRIVSTADDRKGVPYGCPYHSGSHITVHLNLVQHELSFFLNGRPLGVAFRFRCVEDPEPLFPVVVLCAEGDTASFVPPSAPQLPPHIGPLLQAYKPATSSH